MNEYVPLDPCNKFYNTTEEIEEMTDEERYKQMDIFAFFMDNYASSINNFHNENPPKLTWEFLLPYAKYFSLIKLHNRMNEYCTNKRMGKEPLSPSKVPLDLTTLKDDFPLLDMSNQSRCDSIIIKHYCYMLLSFIRVYANRLIKTINKHIHTITEHEYLECADFINNLDNYRQPFIDQLKLYHQKYNTGQTIEEDTPGIDCELLLPFPNNV